MDCGHRVACRQLRHLDTPRVEEGAGADDEGVGLLAPNNFEGGIDLAAGICVEHLDLQSHGASRRLHVSQRDLGQRSKGRVDQHGHTSCGGQQLAQEFEPLATNSPPSQLIPVRLPPGRAKLATSPSLTGSSPPTKTIGIVVVAALTANAEVPTVAMTATRRRTSSAASAGSRSVRLSAQRYSIATFSPSTKPASFKPWWNARN